MRRAATQQGGRRSLLWSKLKLVYTRLTLTKYTKLYFGLAFLTCTILVALQSVAFSINSQAASITSSVVKAAGLEKIIPIVDNGVLKLCDAVPGQPNAHCIISDTSEVHPNDGDPVHWLHSRSLTTSKIYGPQGLEGLIIDQGTEQGQTTINLQCIQSLTWLNDIFRDERREDVVTLVFHMWLFGLSFYTLLHESIPHLGASVASHILITGWASFRVYSASKLREMYDDIVVEDACSGYDVLGDWWDKRLHNAYPVLAFNVLFLGAILFVAVKLFRSYSHQSFSRVGASDEIHKALKLVLVLSVLLHLSCFFTLASAAIWIDKIRNDAIRMTATHATYYLLAFVVIAVLELPRGYLGWYSVRRESRVLFISFMVIALFLLIISSIMFASPLYRYVFHTWSFFATVTVFAFIMATGCTVLGLVCWFYVQGKGLAHYLEVEKALGDAGFSPAFFSNHTESDPEKASKAGSCNSSTWIVNLTLPPKAQLRKMSSDSSYTDGGVVGEKYTMRRKHSVNNYSASTHSL